MLNSGRLVAETIFFQNNRNMGGSANRPHISALLRCIFDCEMKKKLPLIFLKIENCLLTFFGREEVCLLRGRRTLVEMIFPSYSKESLEKIA